MKTVTKRDIATKTAQLSGERYPIVEKITDEVFRTLREILIETSPEVRIEIRDLGVFEVKQTKPKPNARNPRTGEMIYIPAKRKAHFKPGKFLKNILKMPLKE